MDYKDRHIEDTLTSVDDDVEVDCAPIESIHPIPDHPSKEFIKDVRFSSVDSGYCDSVKSFNSGIDLVSDDLEKLKLGSIEEQYHEYVAGEKTDLYEPLDNENAKDEQSGANEENANHQIRETEEILLEIFKPDKDGDS